MTTIGWICLAALPVLLVLVALRWIDRLTEPPAAPCIGREPLPPTRTRAEEIAELRSWYALPDYHRPPSATADSFIDPEDFE